MIVIKGPARVLSGIRIIPATLGSDLALRKGKHIVEVVGDFDGFEDELIRAMTTPIGGPKAPRLSGAKARRAEKMKRMKKKYR